MQIAFNLGVFRVFMTDIQVQIIVVESVLYIVEGLEHLWPLWNHLCDR